MDRSDREYLSSLIDPIRDATDRSAASSERALAEAVTTRQSLEVIQIIQHETSDRLANLSSEVSAMRITQAASGDRLVAIEKWISGNGRPPVEARLTAVEERQAERVKRCQEVHEALDESLSRIEKALTARKQARWSARVKIWIAAITTVGVLGAAGIARLECHDSATRLDELNPPMRHLIQPATETTGVDHGQLENITSVHPGSVQDPVEP